MDSTRWVIPLAEAALVDEQLIGGKTAQLARLHRTGFRIASGFCVTVAAYEQFLQGNKLPRIIQMELGRKPFKELRWEELWDAALRIRNRFSAAELPPDVGQAICRAARDLGSGKSLAVRSSAPGEDSANRSFAGLHESFLNVVGEAAVLEAVRLVWASLWSDAALLYRQELALDPLRSRMAVLIQEMQTEECSGVAFGRDPRTEQSDNAVIEAVPGPCSGLVDGSVDPDHWLISRATRQVVNYRAGHRDSGQQNEPLLAEPDLESLLSVLDQVERQLGWCPDVVCDAIQPMMTHLVPLAAAVVERRGGMLIHGAIIARELGIPCVNGVAHAVDLLQDGDVVTVDGYLGIVTIGPPDFSLELG